MLVHMRCSNDGEQAVSSNVLNDALGSYDVRPVPWSQRA